MNLHSRPLLDRTVGIHGRAPPCALDRSLDPRVLDRSLDPLALDAPSIPLPCRLYLELSLDSLALDRSLDRLERAPGQQRLSASASQDWAAESTRLI